MKRITAVTTVTVLMAMTSLVLAEPKVETVAEGLNVPCGVAIQPGTGHVFVADSAAGRVVRIVDGKVEDVIVDFPIDKYGKGPTYPIGPLGLAFVDENILAVGGGGYPDAKDKLRVYNIPAAGGDALNADEDDAARDSVGGDQHRGRSRASSERGTGGAASDQGLLGPGTGEVE